MADLFNIAALSANTFKKSIEITSHNVANVATEGYHRQRADIVSNASQVVGANTLGGGSRVENVMRYYDQGLQQQLTSSHSSMQRYDQQLTLAKSVEGVVASNDQGVQEFMQRYFDSIQNLSDNPTSSTTRRASIDESINLQSHINNMSQILKDTSLQTNNQIEDTVLEVNERLESIQLINQEVTNALNTGTSAPNDLMDQRDQAIFELGKYVDVKTFYQDDGSVDVYTGNGKLPLISSNTLTLLESGFSEYSDENRVEVYMTVAGSRAAISDQFQSGEMAGIMDFRNNILDKARDDLGVTINGLVASNNWQHFQGWDLNGDPGKELFKPLDITAMGSNKNAGAEDGSSFKVTFNPNSGVSEPPYSNVVGGGINDQPATYGDKETYLQNAYNSIGELHSREYKIQSDGAGNYSFTDYKTGEILTSKAIETPAGSAKYQLEGLEFDLSGDLGSADRDSFIVKPHQAILESFDSLIIDENELATRGQSPVETGSSGGTSGTAVSASSPPEAAAYGDNVNASNWASLASKKILFADANNQASENLLGGYSKMATNVGMYVRGTDIQLTAQTNVYMGVDNQSQSLSGVNLDEEAANLMRFQQAYQAAAQLITSTKQMFDTLIGIMR